MTSFHSLHRNSTKCIYKLCQREVSRIAVAMSGGIDSSVAALLLQQKGYECIGVHMKSWDSNAEFEDEEICCSNKQDFEDMMKVCSRLNIPLYEVDLTKDYWNKVFIPFLDSYRSGLNTPNPDVWCNRYVKFHAFKHYVMQRWGIDAVATGHYARVQHNEINSQLLHSVDALKDQTYFLSMTAGNDLKGVHFPIGDYTKSQVRSIAQEYFGDLNVLQKKESMGICFIGKRKLSDFLSNYLDLTVGRMIDIDTKKIIGYHKGQESYTIGQHARVGGLMDRYYVVGKIPNALPPSIEWETVNKMNQDGIEKTGSGHVFNSLKYQYPWFQYFLNHHRDDALHSIERGDVWFGRGELHSALYTTKLVLDNRRVNWISGTMPIPYHEKRSLSYRLRHGQRLNKCNLTLIPLPNDNTTFRAAAQDDALPHDMKSVENYLLQISFENPQRGLAPGQIISFYENSICLGGGIL